MPTTLVRNPLRTSLSMISGHVPPVEMPEDTAERPLGYLYAAWDPGTFQEGDLELGYYDAESQTWVDTGGFITAGVYTRTRTAGCPGDCPIDDVCQ